MPGAAPFLRAFLPRTPTTHLTSLLVPRSYSNPDRAGKHTTGDPGRLEVPGLKRMEERNCPEDLGKIQGMGFKQAVRL